MGEKNLTWWTLCVQNTVQAIFKAAQFPEATGASLMDKEEIFV